MAASPSPPVILIAVLAAMIVGSTLGIFFVLTRLRHLPQGVRMAILGGIAALDAVLTVLLVLLLVFR